MKAPLSIKAKKLFDIDRQITKVSEKDIHYFMIRISKERDKIRRMRMTQKEMRDTIIDI